LIYAGSSPAASQPSTAAEQAAVDQWLNWEAAKLRPAVYAGGDAAAALQELDSALASSGSLLTGSSITAAEVSAAVLICNSSMQRRHVGAL
jgi:glutathione S-transferase